MAERIKVSDNFFLDEFIDPITYRDFGAQSIWFIDKRIIMIAQKLRELGNNPIIINNWLIGGSFKASGFRRPSSRIGAYLSQHKFGRAIDVKVKGKTPEEVLEIINQHWSVFKALGLSTVEDISFTTTWNHLDIRQTNMEDLLIVKPIKVTDTPEEDE